VSDYRHRNKRLNSLSRLGRRDVLRAGASVTLGALLGSDWRAAPAAEARQASPTVVGGRWIEAESRGLAQSADPSQYVVFSPDFSAYAVAPSWGGSGDPAAAVELLWSPDGVTWSDPIWITRTGHNGRPDRDGRFIGNLVATPGANFFQYRTYDGAGNFATLPEFELDYIDPTAGPSLEQVADPATSPVFDKPPVISRAGWGADEALRFREDGSEIFPVEYQLVEHVIIHHADTANFNDPVLEMRSIYYFHAITRGWGDIAYNYLVDFMGNVYEGRVGGENAVGCHAEGYNHGSCGICLMGRFFEDDTTPEMHQAIVWIASWAGRNLDPETSSPFHDIPELPTICGHRDVNNTTCPGEQFYEQLRNVRDQVWGVINGQTDPEPPVPQWPAGTRVITTGEGTKLREGPGLDFDVAATVAVGQPLKVLEGPATNDGFSWYKVEGPSMTGWIAGSLLAVDPDPNGSPDPVAGTPDSAPATEEPVGGGSDERDGGRNKKDDDKDKRDKERRQEAWPVFAAGSPAFVVGGSLNVREAPGLWAGIVTALPDGYPATIVDGPVEADGIAWYQVATADGLAGWCDSTYLQPG
jgi:uncharacterized protein YgiM (DUF1202 family)